jgi:hypothetical protein
MKRTYLLVFVLALFTFVVYAGGPTDKAGGPKDKATGFVVGAPFDHPLRWQSFDFTAHEGDTVTLGKGFLVRLRLNEDSSEVSREEICEILYVIVEEEDAWFAGPIIYDSQNVLPLRWFVVHVSDGGQPGLDNDVLFWARVATGADALEMVEAKISPPTDLVVKGGNLKVHSR